LNAHDATTAVTAAATIQATAMAAAVTLSSEFRLLIPSEIESARTEAKGTSLIALVS
jgi:hypothetical protein